MVVVRFELPYAFFLPPVYRPRQRFAFCTNFSDRTSTICRSMDRKRECKLRNCVTITLFKSFLKIGRNHPKSKEAILGPLKKLLPLLKSKLTPLLNLLTESRPMANQIYRQRRIIKIPLRFCRHKKALGSLKKKGN